LEDLDGGGNWGHFFGYKRVLGALVNFWPKILGKGFLGLVWPLFICVGKSVGQKRGLGFPVFLGPGGKFEETIKGPINFCLGGREEKKGRVWVFKGGRYILGTGFIYSLGNLFLGRVWASFITHRGVWGFFLGKGVFFPSP